MADAGYVVSEVRFIFEEGLTQVYVCLLAQGDCPIGVQGWHHKTYPASKSADAIFPELARDCVLWPQEAPP